MTKLTDLVPISDVTPFNVGLSSARSNTMVAALGRPSEGIDAQHCRNDKASGQVLALRRTLKVERVECTGLKPAIESLEKLLRKAFVAHPELKAGLISEGMLCVRLRRPTSGVPSTLPSNHSWGTAIDLTIEGYPAPGATGDRIPYFIALLIPFFNEAGWYSGVGFSAHDDMHFEVADETIRRWAAEGAFAPKSVPDRIGPDAAVDAFEVTAEATGLDCAINCTPHASAIASAGVRTVIRYYRWPTSSWPTLSHEEAFALSTAGLSLASIWEAKSDEISNFSYTDGFDQGSSAFNQALKAHQPPTSPIYFAVDFDCSAAETAGPVADYFRGIEHALDTLSRGAPRFGIGAYGSGRCCGWLKTRGFASHTWLAHAPGWAGADTFHDWDIRQGNDDLKVRGLHPGSRGDYDSDEVRATAGTFFVHA